MSKSSRNRGPAWSRRRTRRDPRRHPGRPQRLVRHRPGIEPLEHEDVPLGHRLDDARRDAGLGRRDRVVDLVAAVDGEELRIRTGDPHEERRPVDDDPPVRVGQPGRDPLGGHVRPAQSGIAAMTCSMVGGTARGYRSRYASMVEHARAVIIGGGVGGTSIAYHLAERGWTDIVLVDRAELTSGSTFHSAGLVGQLRSSVTLTKMMMYGADLYRRLAAETGTDPSWHEVGSLRLASSPGTLRGAAPAGGLGQDVRPAARADLGEGGPGPLPADVDRRRPRRGLAADRRLARSVRSGQRAGRRGASARRAGPPAHAGRGDRHGSRPRDRRDRRAPGRANRDRRRRRRQRRRHVRPRDRPDGRGHGPDHPDGPPVPVHRADRGRPPGPAAAPRPGQPRLLPRGGRRPVHGWLRARPGAVVARWHPGRLQRQAAGARHGAFPVDHGGRHPARPGDGRRWRQPGHQRPRGLHARQRVHPRRVGGRVASSSRPGSRRTGSPAQVGSGARWRRGSSTASPSSTSGRWTSGASGRRIEARATRWPARSRTTRPTTTSTTRTRSGSPGGRCGWRRPIRSSQGLGASFGEKSGWERPNWFDSNAAAGDEGLRPRGWAGEHWSPAIGAEALATRRTAGLFDETSFAKIEIVGPGAVAFLQTMCANDVDVPVGRITYTQLLNTRGGIECDVTVTRVAT